MSAWNVKRVLCGLAGVGLVTLVVGVSTVAGLVPPSNSPLGLTHDLGYVQDSNSSGRDTLKIWGTYTLDPGSNGISPTTENVIVLCGAMGGTGEGLQFLFIPAFDAGWTSSGGVYTWQGASGTGAKWILAIDTASQRVMAYWTGVDIDNSAPIVAAPANGTFHPVQFDLTIGDDLTASPNPAMYRNDASGFNASANGFKLRRP